MNNNNRDLEEKLRKRKADMEELKRKRVSLEQQNWGLDDTIRREKQKLFED
jgi:cell division protein FtsB